MQLIIPETKENKMQLTLGELKLDMARALNNYLVTNIHIKNPSTKRIILAIDMERLPTPFVTSLFVPSICLILAAEITLFIDETHFKATISVALTSNLVMYTLYRGIQEKLPEDSQPKLIDIWLLHGLLMPMLVFTILATKELINSNLLNQVTKSKLIKVADSSVNEKHQSPNKNKAAESDTWNRGKMWLGCQALVPIFSIIFIITFFIVIFQSQ